MTVTDPVWEAHDFAPDPRSAFGPIVSAFEIEHAVAACARLWTRDYLAEVCRQRKLAAEALPPFRSLVESAELGKMPEDQCPALLIVATGLDARARVETRGDGKYVARWRVQCGVVVSVRGNRQAVKLARLYTAAVRAMMVQQLPDPRQIPLDVRRVDWTGERYRVFDTTMERTQAHGVTEIAVEVMEATNWLRGPNEPMFPPTDPDKPPPEMNLPEVERVQITVTKTDDD